MLISKAIEEKLNIECRSVNEKEVTALGLAVAEPGEPFATFLESSKYLSSIKSDQVKTIITTEKVYSEIKDRIDCGFCLVEKPRLTFFKLHNALADDTEYARESYNSVIGEGCSISSSASIAAKNVTIGNNVTIEEFVVIRENTVIMDNAIVRAGCKIGGEGFEFKTEGESIFRVTHLGGVVIGKHVEIQYNTCVDKAIYPWDDTVIGDETKIDNLVHVAHGVKLGKCNMVVACSGIGGRVETGAHAWIGLGAFIRNGIKIGSGSRANMGSVVTKSIEDGEAVSGNFAVEHSRFINHIKSVK